MINTNDIVFDTVFEEECDKLDTILLEIAKEIKEEGGYSKAVVEKIIDKIKQCLQYYSINIKKNIILIIINII